MIIGRIITYKNKRVILNRSGAITLITKDILYTVFIKKKMVDELVGDFGNWKDEGYENIEDVPGYKYAEFTEDEFIVYDPTVFGQIFIHINKPIYISVPEFAEKFGVSQSRVRKLCKDDRIKNAVKENKNWLIPYDAEFPEDNRKYNHGKEKHGKYTGWNKKYK